jgi:hypothetical protein
MLRLTSKPKVGELRRLHTRASRVGLLTTADELDFEVPQFGRVVTMPTARSLLAALTLAFTAISCSDKSPTEANTLGDQQAPTAPAVAGRADLLRNLPTSGTVLDAAGNPTSQVIGGTISVTRIDYNQVTGTLEVDGTFTYLNNGVSVTQAFRDIPATLVRGGAPTAPVCDILILDIGRITLDLLGLVVDIAPISIDITAVSGPGNLLGNLLCALVGILDGPRLGGFLGAITNLLNQINAILGAL